MSRMMVEEMMITMVVGEKMSLIIMGLMMVERMGVMRMMMGKMGMKKMMGEKLGMMEEKGG